MTKPASGILLGLGLLGLLGLAVLFAGQQQAQAMPGSGCKQWAVQAYRTESAGGTLPEGWEPFAVTTREWLALRHCVKE
jgi:hypothetical protein